MTSKTEDMPPSSIQNNVSNAFIDMNTKTSSGNPEIDDLSISKALADELDESPVNKRKVHSMATTQTSWIWDHFEKMEEKKMFAFTKICGKRCINQMITAPTCWSGI